MTEEMKAILESKEKHMVIVARAGCVDKDTEFFTGKEWKKISEYEDGDMVLQFNSDWSAELVKPQQYIKEPCDTMNGIISKSGVNMVLSDEHRVMYVDTSSTKEWGKQNILEIKCSEMIDRHRKNKEGFYGKFITTFKLKGREYKYFSSDDEIRLYMAVLSDGHIVNDNTKYVVMTLKKEIKKERLVSLLNNLGIKYVEYKRKDGYTDYSFNFDKCSKTFDFELLNMCEHDRQVLFDEISYWNDYYERFIKSGSVVFSTPIKHNADFIQLLGASLNIRGIIDRVGIEKISNKDKPYTMKTICYNVRFTNKTYVSIGYHSKSENRFLNLHDYKTLDGYKYCFVVPSGMLVLRRGDRIFITGNSGKSYTMLEYIKHHNKERILYLVYNKQMKDEFNMKLKGIKHNATISTIHSLAYKWYVKNINNNIKFKNINVIDIKNILGLHDVNIKILNIIKFYYEAFLASDKETPYDLELLKDEHFEFLVYVELLFKHFMTSDTIQHNVYLKLFQLSKVKIEGYSTIIVDEFNDVNRCMLDIVKNNTHKKIFCIGDPLQNINSFNHSIDGISELQKLGFHTFNLTLSFRVSEEVANLSSRYLSYMYDTKVLFHGSNNTVIERIDLTKADSNSFKIHLLSRTKLGALKEIIRLYSKSIKNVYYVGGLEEYGIKEMENLLRYRGNIYLGGERYHVNTIRKMIEEDPEIVDPELAKIVALYDFSLKYKDTLELLKCHEVTKEKYADIVVQTAHSSKGITVENVILADDFQYIEDVKNELVLKSDSDICEYLVNLSKSEANLYYVAITRATNKLDLNSVLSKKAIRKKYQNEKDD